MAQKPKAKSGRPTKLDAKTVSLLETHLQFGHTVSEACYAAKISRETFYKHYRENPDFSDRMRQARFQLIQLAKQTIYSSIVDGNIKAAMWVVERFAPDSFTVPLDDEIPKAEQSDEEYQKELDQWKDMFFHEFERWFMAEKYNGINSYRPSKDATFEVRQRYDEEKAKDQEILKKLCELPFRID